MARLRGPIIVNAAPQLICRYAADGQLSGFYNFGDRSGVISVK